MKQKIEIQYIDTFSLCSADHFKIIKGIAILMVLVGVVCNKFFSLPELYCLTGVGSAIFLFCSGYGLSESYSFKGGLIHFWENKVIGVWIPSLVQLLLCSMIFRGDFLRWTRTAPLGLSGWFLYILMGCYAAFWAAFTLFSAKKTRLTILLILAASAACILEESLHAELMLAFPLGVMYSQLNLREKTKKLKVPGKLLVTVVCAGLSLGGWYVSGLVQQPMLVTVCLMISKTATAMLVVFGTYFLRSLPVFGVFAPFGIISYGLYLFHGDILTLVEQTDFWKSLGISMAILLAVAGVFSWLRSWFIRFNKKCRRRRKTHLKGAMW